MCPVCGGSDGIAVDEDNIYDDAGGVIGYVLEIECDEPGCPGIWEEEYA